MSLTREFDAVEALPSWNVQIADLVVDCGKPHLPAFQPHPRMRRGRRSGTIKD